MAHLATFYQDWLPHDGKQVTVKGIDYILHVQQYHVWYPYETDMIRVSAEMVDKTITAYQDTRGMLGDDWTTDVLDSDIETMTAFLSAAQAAPARTVEIEPGMWIEMIDHRICGIVVRVKQVPWGTPDTCLVWIQDDPENEDNYTVCQVNDFECTLDA